MPHALICTETRKKICPQKKSDYCLLPLKGMTVSMGSKTGRGVRVTDTQNLPSHIISATSGLVISVGLFCFYVSEGGGRRT